MMNKIFFTIDELAVYLRISRDCAYKLAQQGKIPASKIGRKWRFEKKAIDEWIKLQQNINQMKKKKKILIVDDNEYIRKLIREILEDSFEVFEAQEGFESLKIIGNDTPDLILLDISMPYQDGYELCKYLKSSEGTANIPIILITGQETTTVHQRHKDVGADDYLIKPFDNNMLLFKVKKLIGLV